MKRRQVRFTVTARDHVRTAIDWWRDNRLGTEILAAEMEEAIKFVSLLPGIGAPYHRSTIHGLRRLYLRRVSYHLYYTNDEETVMIRALWHARRGRAPKLS